MDRWTPQQAEEALDEAWTRLAGGQPIADCLAPYPHAADQLLPLLVLAQELRQLGAGKPDPAQLTTGRERFLRRAGEYRRRRASRNPLWAPLDGLARLVGPFLGPVSRHGVAGAAIAVALVAVVLAGTTMMASASSLPGDALYPVKRAAETVQLALTFDEESRASVEAVMERRRLEEARTVLERHREAQLTFHGVVESVEGSRLVASGLTVEVLPATQFVGSPPDQGRVVAVVAHSKPDGRLLAERIDTLEPTRVPKPKQRTPTSTASPTPSVGPTTDSAFEGTPQATQVATVTATITGTVTAEPTVTESLTVTGSETLTPTVTSTPGPETAAVSFAGVIERLEPDNWQVAGRVVSVTAATRIDEGAGVAEVGAWAAVSALPGADGTLQASEIVVLDPQLRQVTLAGTIEGMDGDRWVVSGRTVQLGPETLVVGSPAVGQLARVEGLERQSGAVQALIIWIGEGPSPTPTLTAAPPLTSTPAPGEGPAE